MNSRVRFIDSWKVSIEDARINDYQEFCPLEFLRKLGEIEDDNDDGESHEIKRIFLGFLGYFLEMK